MVFDTACIYSCLFFMHNVLWRLKKFFLAALKIYIYIFPTPFWNYNYTLTHHLILSHNLWYYPTICQGSFSPPSLFLPPSFQSFLSSFLLLFFLYLETIWRISIAVSTDSLIIFSAVNSLMLIPSGNFFSF